MTDIIGIDYGGANCGIIHQDRLVLAGSSAIPDLILASRTTQWTDFRLASDSSGDPLTQIPTDGSDFSRSDSDGFWFQQTTGRGNEFHGLLQQEGLFILGNVGESIVPASRFIQSQVEIRENSWYGSQKGRPPIIAGGLVIFLQKEGQDIRGIAWTEAQRKYVAPSLIENSGRVFSDAVDMTYQPSVGRHGDTVFVINGDGSLSTLLLRVTSDYPAWAQWDTGVDYNLTSDDPPEADQSHRVIGGTAVLEDLALLVERGGRIGVELQKDEDLETTFFDAAHRVTFDSDTSVNLNIPQWMWGQYVDIRKVPPPGQEITEDFAKIFSRDQRRTNAAERIPNDGGIRNLLVRLGAENGDVFEFGMEYERSVETLPFVPRTRQGLKRSIRKTRIIKADLDCVNRLGSPTSDRENTDIWIHETRLRIVPARKTEVGVDTGRRGKPSTSGPSRDTRSITRLEWAGVCGWRDRVAMLFSSRRHLEIAGISYRAVG